jgi:phenylalanyl-tRNA synthetase alpha chain
VRSGIRRWRKTRAWELSVDVDGAWFEVLAWGVFSDKIVRHLGGDPVRHTAVGFGCGLERVAMLRYGIDDIRKVRAPARRDVVRRAGR